MKPEKNCPCCLGTGAVKHAERAFDDDPFSPCECLFTRGEPDEDIARLISISPTEKLLRCPDIDSNRELKDACIAMVAANRTIADQQERYWRQRKETDGNT